MEGACHVLHVGSLRDVSEVLEFMQFTGKLHAFLPGGKNSLMHLLFLVCVMSDAT